MTAKVQVINQSETESLEIQQFLTDSGDDESPVSEIETVGPGKVSKTYRVQRLHYLSVREVGG